jgi:aminoglycoside phosphotransferase (APT) family kinase protein
MLQLAEQLGRIHAMPLSVVGSLLEYGSEDAAARAAELDSFADCHAKFGLRSKIVDAAIAWLRAHSDLAGDTLSLVHNDFGFHNVLVNGDTLTAILDWELAKAGHPASDLGYIKHFVDKVVPWDEFIARYVEAGGFRIPAETIRYHAVWNAVRLYGLIMIARHNLEIGRVNDMEITYACADNVMLLIAFLGREIFSGEIATSDA